MVIKQNKNSILSCLADNILALKMISREKNNQYPKGTHHRYSTIPCINLFLDPTSFIGLWPQEDTVYRDGYRNNWCMTSQMLYNNYFHIHPSILSWGPVQSQCYRIMEDTELKDRIYGWIQNNWLSYTYNDLVK